MASTFINRAPRRLIGLTQVLLLALAAALALLLVAEAFALSVVTYAALAYERMPQPYEVSGTLGYCTILVLIFAFVLTLRRIVMAAADAPFTPRNAVRLQRLGWIALAWQVVVVVLAASGHQINIVNQPELLISLVDARSYSAGGAIMVLALFVLAHVFRQGTALDAELEGTV